VRIAVVTPYFTESREVLERCLASVRGQAVPVDHVLVADGNPQYWIEAHANVTHVVLQKSAGDFGDTPRSIGFVVAMRDGYDLIQFLDADNILTPDHFEYSLKHFRGRPAAEYPDLVVARRQMLRADGTVINAAISEDDALRHIDTSCYIFHRTSFHVGLKWCLIPRELGFMDDRVFYALLMQKHPGLKIVFNKRKTVGYTCLWESVYRMIGEEPPPNRKNLDSEVAVAREWWRGLDPHSKRVIERTLGLPILIPEAGVGRQA